MSVGLVASNPTAQVPRPRPKRSIPKHWTPEQAREFLGLMETDRTWPIWAFLLGSGLRIGELVWLRWPNVDLGHGWVRVVDFASTLGHDLVPSMGKSHDAVRTIELDDGLGRCPSAATEAPSAKRRWSLLTMSRASTSSPRESGGHTTPNGCHDSSGIYSKELGLPRLTAHGLRHTSATLMLAGGVPPKVAAERLGHADPTLFTNLYSHVTPTMQRDAADRIGEALFGPLVDSDVEA